MPRISWLRDCWDSMNHDVQICLSGYSETNEGVGTDIMDWLKFSVAKVFFSPSMGFFFGMRDFLEGFWHPNDGSPWKFWNFFFLHKKRRKCVQQKKDAIWWNPWLLGSFKKLHQGLATANAWFFRKLRLWQPIPAAKNHWTQFVMFFVLRWLFSDRKTLKNMGKCRTD